MAFVDVNMALCMGTFNFADKPLDFGAHVVAKAGNGYAQLLPQVVLTGIGPSCQPITHQGRTSSVAVVQPSVENVFECCYVFFVVEQSRQS